MFYLIAVPVFILISLQVVHLLELKKHDEHLFKFCQLRRESLELLANSYGEISRNDYLALRKLIQTESVIIGSYKEHKTVVFNFRIFLKNFNDAKVFNDQSKEISTNNEDIKRLIGKMQFLIANAFLAYTPFLKSELMFQFAVRASSMAVTLGFYKFKEVGNRLKEARNLLDSYGKNACC